jgi:hypothetical protein
MTLHFPLQTENYKYVRRAIKFDTIPLQRLFHIAEKSVLLVSVSCAALYQSPS